jgi:hypothetical protein
VRLAHSRANGAGSDLSDGARDVAVTWFFMHIALQVGHSRSLVDGFADIRANSIRVIGRF